jgi:glycine cleavage system H protein
MDLNSYVFTESHEWVYLHGGLATVGISRFAVDQLSDLINIELKPVGTHLSVGQSFGTIDSVKSVSDLFAPIAGEVVEVNDVVVDNVQAVAEDPYGRGWLIMVRVDDLSSIPQLMALEDYNKMVAEL